MSALQDIGDYIETCPDIKDNQKVAVVGHNAFIRIHMAKEHLLRNNSPQGVEAFIPEETAVNLTNAELYPHPDFLI
jgi:hypothetical protein